ncbi:hypothetical protein E4U41_006533, partial [Claviceps citrina]
MRAAVEDASGTLRRGQQHVGAGPNHGADRFGRLASSGRPSRQVQVQVQAHHRDLSKPRAAAADMSELNRTAGPLTTGGSSPSPAAPLGSQQASSAPPANG